MSESRAATPEGWRFVLRSLRSRNYRLFFGGQLVSLVGSWLSTVATSWLVYRLTNAENPEHAAKALGLVNFAGQIPVFLLSPVAGVLVDRFHRHRILILTQTLSMLQSFALAALALGQVITTGDVILLSAFQGIVNAFDVPARQSFVVEIVEDRADLSNAIALSSSMVHGARLLGPALAGYLIYRFSEGACFLIDGVSYLAVIVALAAMRIAPRQAPAQSSKPWQALREGVIYSFGFSPIRSILALVAVTSLMAMSQSVLMPIFADRILNPSGEGSERLLGLLLGASGCGAFAGTMYLASRRTVLGLGRVIAGAGMTLGAALLVFAMSRSLALSLPMLLISGGALVVAMASCNTVLQTIVDDDKRGRVMSLFTMAFLGVAPFGSLLAGTAADAIGAPTTLSIAGTVLLASSGTFALSLKRLRPLIRPIYQRKGILPQVAEGMRTTAAAATAARE